MAGEQLCLSKARSNFEAMWKRPNSTKFLRVPVGQTFDSLRLALPVSGAPKGTGVCRKCTAFATVFLRPVGKMYWYCTSIVPVVPCRKGVCYKQKIQEENQF